MSNASQSKSLAVMFLLGAFLTGGALGFAADRAMTSTSKKAVTRAYTVKEGRDELAKELGLSEAQRRVVDSILDWRNERDKELLQPVRPQRDANRDSARTLIRLHLDTTQQRKFNEVIERMRVQSEKGKNQQQSQ